MHAIETQLNGISQALVNLTSEMTLLEEKRRGVFEEAHSNVLLLNERVVSCISVDSDYDVQSSDHYIGVSGVGAVALYLPSNPKPGKQYIIKMEDAVTGMGSATVLCKEGHRCIDGNVCFVLRGKGSSLHILYHNDSWNIISNYHAGHGILPVSSITSSRKGIS